MKIRQARHWVFRASLIASGSAMAFFFLAPALNYPLEWAQSMRILQMLCPVFAAYLAAAGRSMAKIQADSSDEEFADPSLANLMIKGPFWLYALSSVALVAAFWLSNSSATLAEGMSIDVFAGAFALILSFLTGSTHYVVEHLFAMAKK